MSPADAASLPALGAVLMRPATGGGCPGGEGRGGEGVGEGEPVPRAWRTLLATLSNAL